MDMGTKLAELESRIKALEARFAAPAPAPTKLVTVVNTVKEPAGGKSSDDAPKS